MIKLKKHVDKLNRTLHPHISKAVLIFLVVIGLGAILLLLLFVQEPQDPKSLAQEQSQKGDKPTWNIADPSPNYVPGELLVKFNGNVSQDIQGKLLTRFQAKEKGNIPQIGVKIISLPEQSAAVAVEALKNNPSVEFAELNYRAKAFDTTPNDYWWSSEWGEIKTQTNKAWDITRGNSNVIIAIVDSGVDLTHPDLQGKLMSGRDIVNSDADPTDDHGHGTQSAGVAGAFSNNTIGLASYCWECRIMPVKVLDATANGTYFNIASGIIWAADNGAKVINLSLGGSTASSLLDSAVTYALGKESIVVASAGNSGTTGKNYPAASPGAISVAGTDSSDQLYGWSNYGSWVKVSAPGCNISTGRSGLYGTFCGTSSAAPAVSGIAGLIWSAKPTATPTEIEQAILSTLVPSKNTYYDQSTGTTVTRDSAGTGGRIDAYASLQVLTGGIVPPTLIPTQTPTNAPIPSPTLPALDTVAPIVTIKFPLNGSTIGNKATVSATATDNIAVTRMEVYIDGALKTSSTASSISYNWNSRNVSRGSHTIAVKAYDAKGNVGSSSVGVTK